MIRNSMIDANLEKIRINHSWGKIVSEYEDLFIQSYLYMQ